MILRTLVALAIIASPCLAQDPTGQLLISGNVRVSDGDTITINRVRVRLRGIDAAENGQQCNAKGGGTWDCAQAATKKLASLIQQGKEVRCELVDVDTKSNRPVARCFLGGVDIQRELVRDGLAWAYREFESC